MRSEENTGANRREKEAEARVISLVIGKVWIGSKRAIGPRQGDEDGDQTGMTKQGTDKMVPGLYCKSTGNSTKNKKKEYLGGRRF
jgi:hypothetical protein